MNLSRDCYVDMAGAAEKLGMLSCKDPVEAVRVKLVRANVPMDRDGRKRIVLLTSLEEYIKRSTRAAKFSRLSRTA